jgi:hypothetical protein
VRERAKKRSRASLVQAASVIAVGALLVGGAIVAQGFDVKQTPLNDGSVWALNIVGGSERYARVNTELHEIDTVKSAESASGIVQSDDTVLLFARANQKIVDVDAAKPLDYKADAAEFASTPAGTVSVASSDRYVAYLTATGEVWVAPIADGAGVAPVRVDPYADDEIEEGAEPRTFVASAITVTTTGLVYAYSSEDSTMLRYDVAGARIEAQDAVSDGPTGAGPLLTAVGSTWVLADSSGESLWIEGRTGAIPTNFSGAFAPQSPSADGSVVYLADTSGLLSFDLSSGASERLAGDDGVVLGTPTAPLVRDSDVYGAWLGSDDKGGVLFTTLTDMIDLDYAGTAIGTTVSPVFQTNGSRVILNDTSSGWVWTVPDGRLVASSQDWSLATTEDAEQLDEQEQATENLEPGPPVAEPDSLGVRAGAQVILPVLLNDHDPNEDILTIVPDSLSGLSGDFGSLSVIENAQAIAIDVAPGAKGTASFTYTITDGTRGDGGFVSDPAKVTLTVYGPDVNNAPQWCGGDDECLREWPEPEVLPGGTVDVPVLSGWVDPEGDPIFVSAVENPSDLGAATSTTDGSVVYQHGNRVSTDTVDVPLTVTVSDTGQKSDSKVLTVRVTPSPELVVEPFALTAIEGEPLTIDPARYVTGATGTFSVSSATVPAGVEGVTANADGGATFEFQATRSGSSLVTFVIADEVAEVEGTVRVTTLTEEQSALSTAPVTVFVRPKADTTVDVFTAVSNPAGRVLLLSDARPDNESGASLDVDVVGQKVLRVRGASKTLEGGKLGVIGYTVSDGRSGDGGAVNGQATVYMLPAVAAQAPLAVNDSVVVRANAQIDIPVLDNDVAPNGNILVLNPVTVENPSKKGLAFGSGSVVRYLAPNDPGTYELRYDVYSAGSPLDSDEGIITVEVLPNSENLPPRPLPLTGRVLSGETIELPFDGYGIDPDGDEVALETISSQPSSGTASISADGASIRYSSVIGFQGAVSFEYTVRDSRGERGTATVRVGVLDQQSDPSPITFSDYVEVQVGAENTVNVYPIANDLDPSGFELTLGAVTPDAEAGSREFKDLAGHIDDVTDNQLTLTAGTEAGTFTYTYEVSNSEGDTGAGYIVMKVVRDAVPDFPIVTDTVLSIEDRAKFPQGIDVVTGKVSWATGDIDKLELSLYGKPSGVSLSGWRIKGEVPDDGLTLPFVLTGKDYAGEKITTYGFFRIPAKDSIILALRAGDVLQTVKENASVSFDMAKLVPVPTGDVLEVSAKGLRSSGQRAAGQCSLVGTVVTYKAGAGSPWSDSCSVPVRIVGQDNYTQLVVPIAVEPPEPQPELRPASLTLSPAAKPVEFDLRSMVRWQGAADDDNLVFAVNQTLTQFDYSIRDGRYLTLNATDTANPGREESISVSITSHQNVTPSRVTLKVGPAPAVVPKGGTASGPCKQSDNKCAITVIGVPGEYNIYETPLVLNDVESQTSCPGVTLSRLNDTQVAVSWTDDAAGAKCEAHFTVRDAQKKVSSAGDRDGLVTVDFKGFPKAPASVEQATYDNLKLTLRVEPGAAASAYPPIERFAVYQGSTKVAQCSTSGTCETITTARNGDPKQYSVKAVNEIGESKSAVTTDAWSYAAPGIGAVTATAVYDSRYARENEGAVRITIQDAQPLAQGYYINGSDSATNRSNGGSTTVTVKMKTGQQTVTVVPKSSDARPTHGVGPQESTGSTNVTVVGVPKVTAGGDPTVFDNTSITVEPVSVDPNYSTETLEYRYIAYRANSNAPSCSVNNDGDNFSTNASSQSTERKVTNLTPNKNYKLKVCVSNGFGVTEVGAGSAATWVEPIAPAAATYDVEFANGSYDFVVPTPANLSGYSTKVSDYDDQWGPNPVITAAYCADVENVERCGPAMTYTPESASRAYKVQVNGITASRCYRDEVLTVSVQGRGLTGDNHSVTNLFTKDAILTPATMTTGTTVGPAAILLSGVRITWAGGMSGFSPYDYSYPSLSQPTCSAR